MRVYTSATRVSAPDGCAAHAREARRLQPLRVMPSFRRSLPVVVCALFAAAPAWAQRTRIDKQQPCEAYSEASAVFVGIAGEPVQRRVQLPGAPPVEMTLTPITVARAYFGVITPVVYLTPLGIEQYATPGHRYLVYGRAYRPPDIFIASPGFGAKPIERAADDLAFLDRTAAGVRGGTLTGVVQHTDIAIDRTVRARTPLERVAVRVWNEKHSTETVTGPDGRFSVSLPAGVYRLVPELPEDLVVNDSTSRIQTQVDDGGCATVTIEAFFNGRVRGVLRGPDGHPLRLTTVDLIPADLERTELTGEITGMGSVTTNRQGEFEFDGRPPGRYYLGVSLSNAPDAHGPSYPRTYYPGTTDPNGAIPIVVERGRPGDGFDFSIPAMLAKGELEAIVDSEYAGELELCYVQLEDLHRRRATYTPRRGVPLRFPVVDGQRYEVHAHLKYPGGHLESEPAVFTATTEKTTVRLRPDAPRELH